MNAERLQAALEQDLRQDCEAYTNLLRLGESLHACLLERDSSMVEATNREITGLLEQVAVRAQRRNRILGAFSLSASERGMQKLIASCEALMRARLEACWIELGRLVQACHQQNERNGKLLAMQQDILNQLLDQGSPSTIYAPQYY